MSGSHSIVWVKGVPQPAGNVAPISKATMNSLLGSALALEYICTEKDIKNGFGPRFEGKTNAEVAMIKLAMLAAAGDYDATKEIMDRTMGKPKQEIEKTTKIFTYQDYLQAEIEKDKAAAIEAQSVKVLPEYAEEILLDEDEEEYY